MLDMFVFQIALGILAGNFLDGVDQQDLTAVLQGLIGPADHDARFHRRVEEQIWTKADNTFHQIAAHQLFTHILLFVAEQDAMREKNRTAAGVRLQALQNMLKERIVRAALGRCAKEVPTVFIVFKGSTIPLLDGVGRIGQHQIKLFELASLDKSRVFQRVIVDHMKVLNAMKEQIHAADGAGQLVDLLAVDLQIAPLFALFLEVGYTGNQHAGAAAGGVYKDAIFDTNRKSLLRHISAEKGLK